VRNSTFAFFLQHRGFTLGIIGRTPTFQIRPINTQQLAGTSLQSLSHLPIPLYSSPVQPNPYLDQDGISGNTIPLQIPFIPGGGLTRRILSSISTSKWEIPVASLVHFAMEGDNRVDANLLASVVAKVLGIEVSQWKQPGSWHVGLFGTPHDQSLYG
jgi:proteasome assembly chaperone 2